MKNCRHFLLILCSAIVFCNGHANGAIIGAPPEQEIIVNNRILAKANGKAISVIDVMKKMDMQFYRQYPQYASSAAARYQFYQANWKRVLSELIDKELIVADSEEGKMTVSAGDVRQEMESMFGPNIIANLDKAGLTFDEASQMVLADIIIRRMMYFRVQSKAIAQATPQKIKEFYDVFAKSNIRDNEWVYRVITIRHRDASKAAETANIVRGMLTDGTVGIDDLSEKWKTDHSAAQRAPTVNVSEEFHTKELELSDSFRTSLVQLSPESYSVPVTQKSRSDNSTVVRIFYLKAMNPGGPVPFSEVAAKIKDKLIDDAMDKETKTYLNKLRQHFDVHEEMTKDVLNSDFQPFILK